MIEGPYRRIENFPYYKINANGIIRMIHQHGSYPQGYYLLPHINKKSARYHLRNTQWKSKRIHAAVLAREVWGLPLETSREWVLRVKEFLHGQNQILIEQRQARNTSKAQKIKFTRRCCDCRRPTNNFRCEKCWVKLRDIVEENGELEGPEDWYTVHM